MSDIGYLYLQTQPFKKDKAWQIVPKGAQVIPCWVPYSVIKSYNPGSLKIEIEGWFLRKSNIPFKV